MVAPRLRSRSKKRMQVKTPGGETVIRYKRKKPSKHTCGMCKKTLGGTPNAIPSKIGKMTKSQKVPERMYAGVLCNECTEALVRYRTRLEVKYSNEDFKDIEFQRDLTIEKFLPVGWFAAISKR